MKTMYGKWKLWICCTSVCPASFLCPLRTRYWLSFTVSVSKWIHTFSKLMGVRIFHFIQSNKFFKDLWISCTIDLHSWFFLVCVKTLFNSIYHWFLLENWDQAVSAEHRKLQMSSRQKKWDHKAWRSGLHCHWIWVLPSLVEAWLGKLKVLPLHGQWRNTKPLDPFRKMW